MEDFSTVPRVVAAWFRGLPSPSTVVGHALRVFVIDCPSWWLMLCLAGPKGAILALVALGRASFAIADYPEAPAAGAFWAAGHERVDDFADVQLLPKAS